MQVFCRLARALTPGDFAAVFADPDQLSLFAPPMDSLRPILDTRPGPLISSIPTTELEFPAAPEPEDDV
jgi:DNA polymerase I